MFKMIKLSAGSKDTVTESMFPQLREIDARIMASGKFKKADVWTMGELYYKKKKGRLVPLSTMHILRLLPKRK